MRKAFALALACHAARAASDDAERASAAPTASDNTDAAPARHVVGTLAGAVATLVSLLA